MGIERIAIIGAGPSGLTAARQAVENGMEPVVFERRGRFGGRWNYTSDPKYITHLPSTRTKYSKISSSFSDFPISDHFPEFLSQPEVMEYLEGYVDKYDIEKYLKLESNVINVKRHEQYEENGLFIVTYEKAGQVISEEFPYVLLATGRAHKAWRPNPYRKEKEFKGKISHSAEYKGNSAFEGKKVVLIGFGDSAVEIANDLAFAAKQVIICARHGEWLNYRFDASGHPTDHSFNCKLSQNLRRVVPKPILNKTWEKNSIARLNLERHGVERPTFGYWNTIPTFADGLKEHLASGKVRLEKDFLSFDETSVEFSDRKAENNVDHVIFCTGYEFNFSVLENGTLIRVRDNDTQLYLHMFHPELSRGNLAVIGLANPFGPNWPIAELQARLFFALQRGLWPLPSEFELRERAEWKRCQISVGFLKTRRHTQIEDFVGFSNELSSKFGVEIPWSLWITDPTLAYKCLVTPLSPAQFRLKGVNTRLDAKEYILSLKSNDFTVLWLILAAIVLFMAWLLR